MNYSIFTIRTAAKRPVITAFIIYALFLIVFDAFGGFSPQNMSALWNFEKNKKNHYIAAKVISQPESTKRGQKFTALVFNIDGITVKEKVLVNAPQGYEIKYGGIFEASGRLKLAHLPKSKKENYNRARNSKVMVMKL